MEVNSVGAAAGSASQAANRFAELDSAEFIRVLITELQNQDPLQPQDTQALIEQLSGLRNIESQTQLSEQLGELVLQNQVAAAGNMIGKLVQGIDSTNSQASGLVVSVRVKGDQVVLELDNGRSMEMSQVTGIAAGPAESATAAAG